MKIAAFTSGLTALTLAGVMLVTPAEATALSRSATVTGQSTSVTQMAWVHFRTYYSQYAYTFCLTDLIYYTSKAYTVRCVQISGTQTDMIRQI
ncbi:hypothetical protein ACFFMN_24080 [Planobispora siamensis]|uniref:Uncharacterized protein n=1 Tax=Planobispora siamensis TaxID=936338 RepID=A0A8J3SRV5_9ACTN|nr:hypothetical protein [Planobispora siamensis]GIH97731.1 hypothetical protein Psi01_83610 [Planobispora siamensis]